MHNTTNFLLLFFLFLAFVFALLSLFSVSYNNSCFCVFFFLLYRFFGFLFAKDAGGMSTVSAPS